MFKIKSWQVGIGVVAMVLSIIVVFQLRTEDQIGRNLPTRRVNELSQIFKSQTMQIKKYEREIQDLRKQLNDYDKDREIVRLKVAAGMLPLTGKGLRIVLGDSTKKLKDYDDPVFYIVHYDQLELTINELWAAGAEAIAVNGYRLGNTSGFSCAGTTILIDTKRLAPPYIIETIGDPKNLQQALLMPGGFIENQILSFNLQFEIQPVDELRIPAYKGGISFEYAKPVEEETQP